MTSSQAKLLSGLSAVVPVYNSASTIAQLVERTAAVLEQTGRPFEIVLVNDGSADDSWQKIVEQAARRPWLRGINLMRNYGQHPALLCGVRAARYDVIVTLDDDLQNPPEELPRLLEKLDEGHDVVYGTLKQRHHSFGHNIASALLKLALSVAMGAKTAQIVSPLRAFRTRLRDGFADNRNPSVILDVFLTWSTTKFAAVPVRHDARAAGAPTYTLRRRLVTALDLITGFSTMPLRVASLIGFFFTLFGIALLGYVLSVYFRYGGSVPGWLFLASTISIFAGAQMFAMGIIGEYLARMFVRTMERPPYTVAETAGAAEALSAAATPPNGSGAHAAS